MHNKLGVIIYHDNDKNHIEYCIEGLSDFYIIDESPTDKSKLFGTNYIKNKYILGKEQALIQGVNKLVNSVDLIGFMESSAKYTYEAMKLYREYRIDDYIGFLYSDSYDNMMIKYRESMKPENLSLEYLDNTLVLSTKSSKRIPFSNVNDILNTLYKNFINIHIPEPLVHVKKN
jgi:hypothetical protein